MISGNLRGLTGRLVALAGLFVVGLLALSGEAWASGPATSCTAPFAGSATEIVVPGGATCTLQASATVEKSVQVEPGGSLIVEGASIGKDLRANSPVGIQIGGSKQTSIGHDVQIKGLTGQIGLGDNYICNAKIGHDLHAEHSVLTAAKLVVGDAPDCSAGVLVSHDIHVQNNDSNVDVSSISAGHDIHVENNTAGVNVSSTTTNHDLHVQNNSGGVVVSFNKAGHNATCQNNLPSTEGENNTQTKGKPKGCPAPPSPPSVKKVSPDKGPLAGGTTVTITGSGFTGVEVVKFGSTEASGVNFVSDTTITVTSPSGVGKVTISVKTPYGTGSGGHFEYK
jgi:hypothetical protein